MVERADWVGLLRDQRTTEVELTLVAPLAQNELGESKAFIARASDGQRYWVKPLNNPQGRRVPITEQIVGRMGVLINAPTRPVVTLGITSDSTGWEFTRGRRLEEGIAHASLNLESRADATGLERRYHDHNATRHAAILGLYDWCWGGEPQGLLDLTDDYSFHSHDHGAYLPPEGPSWETQALLDAVELAHELDEDSDDGITTAHVEPVVAALRSVSRAQIRDALAKVPSTWPVSDEELECVGFFLERRAKPAAERLLHRFGGAG